MKLHFKVQALVVICLFFYQFSFAQNALKVACIGNSITYGSGIANRVENNYPSQLQKMLGSTVQVQNFGVSGATLLMLGDKPYWKESAFRDALDYKPDVVIIKLGTNDTKPFNWDLYGQYFSDDYKRLVQRLRKANPDVQFLICLPVPVFGDAFNIRESVMTNEVLKLVKQVASDEKLPLVDLHTPLLDKVAMFPDKIHPNADGAKVIAQLVFDALKKNRLVK